jgi:hypothetical protein
MMMMMMKWNMVLFFLLVFSVSGKVEVGEVEDPLT